MNSHNPFDTGDEGVCPNDTRSRDQLVDRLIGNSYWIVKRVYMSIGHVDTVATNIDKITTLSEAMDVLRNLNDNLTALADIYNNMDDLLVIATAMDELKEISSNIAEIMYVYDLVKTKGFIITVDSQDALTALDSARIHYARVYSDTSSGYSYIDYAFIEGNTSGIPAHDSTTGSWVAIGSSTNALTLNSIAKLYSSTSGQTTLVLDEEALGVSAIYLEGNRQHPDQGFTYNGATRTITFAEPMEQDGLEIVVIAVGVLIEGQNSLFDALKGTTGATLIGTASGNNVQQVLDGLEQSKLTKADLVAGNVTYKGSTSTVSRTVQAALYDFVNLHDYYLADDGSDWLPAFNRALTVSPNLLIPFGTHTVSNYVNLPSNTILFGLGAASIIKCPDAIDAAGSNLTTVIRADSKDNITLTGFTVSGGVTETNTTKRNVRTIRFINCTNVSVNSIRVLNNADWATSFEGGSDISVTNYYQKSYKYTNTAINLSGGRDGLHFTDVSNVNATNLDIDSGDDCIGITTTGVDMDNIHISNVSGTSALASIVIFNEEQDSSGNYYSCNLTNLTIDGVSVKKGGRARNIVRVVGYSTSTVIKTVRITNVMGTAYNSFGLWVSRASDVYLNGIDVKSQQAHGIQLNNISKLSGSAKGVYLDSLATGTATYVGVNLTAITNSNFSPISYESASYGAQVSGCSSITITPDIYNCGANMFASSAGGNLRIVNSTDVNVPSGRAVGAVTVSYWGINQSGNTNIDFGLDFVFGGYTNTVMPSSYYLKMPTVVVKLKEDSTGTVATHMLKGATVVRNSVGNYTITFSTSMRSTNFVWQMSAFKNNALIFAKQMSAMGVNTFTAQVVTAADAATYPDHFTFIGYNAVS